MKKALLTLLLLLNAQLAVFTLERPGGGTLHAQEVRVVEDESCGCDLVYVNGVETTKSGEYYGFRLEDGTVIAPNIYRYVDQFNHGYCRVMLDLGQCGMIDSTGRQVIPCIYDNIGYPSDGRILVEKGGLKGYTDMEGREVIVPQYPHAGDFSEGCATIAVVKDSFFVYATFIDTLGRQLFPPDYEDASAFRDGYAPVKQYERWGMIDHSGRMVLPTRYEIMTAMQDTLFFAGDENGMALFDGRMEPLTGFVYTWAGEFSDGRVPVMRNGKYGFLDRKGREVIPCSYEETGGFRMGRTMVRKGNRYGIIDTTGRYVLPLEYESTTLRGDKYMYHDSLALVEKEGKFGYVDLEGQLVIPFWFDDAYQFSEGLASVRHNGLWGYVDTRGEVFMPFIFDLASPYRYGRAEVVYQGLTRKVNRKGKCVKNCKGIIAWRNWEE